MDNLDAPQWVDLLMSSSPNDSDMDDYFSRKHDEHERDFYFLLADSDLPTKNESITQPTTPVRIVSAKEDKRCGKNKANGTDTYENTLVETMKNLQLSLKKPKREEKSVKPTSTDSPGWKTPVKKVARCVRKLLSTPKINLKESHCTVV